MALTFMVPMSTMKGSGQGTREVGGDGCTLQMGPSMKESGHTASGMAKDCCSCVSSQYRRGNHSWRVTTCVTWFILKYVGGIYPPFICLGFICRCMCMDVWSGVQGCVGWVGGYMHVLGKGVTCVTH